MNWHHLLHPLRTQRGPYLILHVGLHRYLLFFLCGGDEKHCLGEFDTLDLAQQLADEHFSLHTGEAMYQ